MFSRETYAPPPLHPNTHDPALLARIQSLEVELRDKSEDVEELEAALVELETETSQQLAVKEQELRLMAHQHELAHLTRQQACDSGRGDVHRSQAAAVKMTLG